MTTNQNSPSNQTLNGSNNDNNQTSAAQATETVFIETNSTIMEEKKQFAEENVNCKYTKKEKKQSLVLSKQ